MPELPEVETITQQLKKQVFGKKIIRAKAFDQKIADKSINKLASLKIVKVWRRAKAIIINLEDVLSGRKLFLFFRLGMTGHFHYIQKQGKQASEEYLVSSFYFGDGSSLTFNDIRRFGSVRLYTEDKLKKVLDSFGPEPLSKKFTASVLHSLFQKRKKANIKVTLMDQKFIAGIGNIYAQEALYAAGVDPRRKIDSLSFIEVSKLYNSLQLLLKLAIKKKGSSVDNYSHLEGSGDFQNYLLVYQRKNCPKKHKLVKIYQGGRGTFYCPQCQK
ncbi:bifunctional DNA-formamidopyrimidine glycosylase/DNA-(apurinic or apyrimidinic site) lyase [Candidatus Woesearchaeota archaeon]|nr:bifunctional DNA-formamidopyrimidine glycosylase/DNA-(apurinic or apyrimidinic site) lyase [Candidatus Woesearchaeota archaeon]